MKPVSKRNVTRAVWILVFGFLLGSLLTVLAELVLPESAARSFLTSSVSGTLGPVSVDLATVAFTMGPVSFAFNVLTLVGIGIMAFVIRSLM